MKKILAVSGGIDSMVMLHIFRNDPEVIVAHFNHGIRSNSDDDENFVARVAEEYGLDFRSAKAHLGGDCSEELARKERYKFLRQLAQELNGEIFIAHHADDLIESVAINVLRGTGWRGLAPMSNESLQRPLLGWSKRDIYRYATEHEIRFRQDQTNTDEKYLRNRVRASISAQSEKTKEQLLELIAAQRRLAIRIKSALEQIEQTPPYSRELVNIDDDIAQELLREIFRRYQISQTRPQLQRAILAIRNFAPNKRYSINKTYYLEIGRQYFRLVPATIADQA